MNPIVTITPSLARPGSHCLLICAESREAFATVVLELMREWERVEISEPAQLPLSAWWHGSGRVRNKVVAPSRERVRARSRDLTVRATRHKGRLNSFVTDGIAGNK